MSRHVRRGFPRALEGEKQREGMFAGGANAVEPVTYRPRSVLLGGGAAAWSAASTSMHQVPDGEIPESWGVFDAPGLLQQLGVTPTPEQTG